MRVRLTSSSAAAAEAAAEAAAAAAGFWPQDGRRWPKMAPIFSALLRMPVGYCDGLAGGREFMGKGVEGRRKKLKQSESG